MKTLTRILLAVLSVILAVLLVLTTLYTAALSGIRSLYTPEYVYNLMNSLDYAALELPDGEGGTATILDITNAQIADFGIRFSEDDFNSVIRTFSIDAVFTSFVQDLRSWLLDDGPVPSLNPQTIAETVLSGLDQRVYSFLSVFGDPASLLADALTGITQAADLSEQLSSIEPVRELLSEGTLLFVISISGTLVLLILITRRLRLVPTMVLTGAACTVSGIFLLFADTALAPIKTQMLIQSGFPETTLDIFYLPLMDSIHQNGIYLSLGGLAVLVIFAVFGAFSSMIRREKTASAEAAARRMNAYNAFDMPYPQTPAPEQQEQQEENDNTTDF